MALPRDTQLVKVTESPVSSFLIFNARHYPWFYLHEKSVGILLDVMHLSSAFSLISLVKLKCKEIAP